MSVAKAAGRGPEDSPVKALAIIASIIGRRHGVTLRFDPSARTASTDGKTIVLPLIKDLGTEDHAVLIEGLVDHEAMHCRFTDFESLRAIRKRHPQAFTPFAKTLHNWFEDVWGEREQAVIYPGCARNILRSMEVMIRMNFYGEPTPGSPEAALFLGYLGQGLLARLYQNKDLAAFALAHRQALLPTLGEPLLDEAWRIAIKIDAVRSTEAAWSLAEEVIRLLKTSALALPSPDKPDEGGGASPRPSQGGDTNDSSSDDSGASGSEQGRAAQGDSEQSGSEPGDSQQGDPEGGGSAGGAADRPGSGQDGSGQGASQPQQGAAGAAGGQPGERARLIAQILGAPKGSCGTGDAGERLMAALRKGGAVTQSTLQASHALALAEAGGSAGCLSRYPVNPRVPRNGGRDTAALDLVRGIEVKLGLRLEAALEARSQVAVSYASVGRRIDARRLPGALAGRTDVFRHTEEGQALDTVVSVLVDASMSMDGLIPMTRQGMPEQIAKRLAASATLIAVGNCLEKFGIPFAVDIFGSSHVHYKGFEEAWRRARSYQLVVDLLETATDLACVRVSRPLLTRSERRKVLLLITDGLPGRPAAALAVLAQLARQGLEVAVVFIDAAPVPDPAWSSGRFFNDLVDAGHRATWAPSVDQLAGAVFEAVNPTT